jgi:hypothetical protein
MSPLRREQIDGRDIFVFDDLLPADEVAQYARVITQAAFTRTESARPDSGDIRHWVCEMPLENLPRTSLWHATAGSVAALRPDERYIPYRCYTNFAAYGDVLLTHVDSLPDRRELTALWFLCDRWDIEWGGETLFFDSAGEARIAVAPRPARLLLFDGAIRHAGRPPNRNCPASRYTFAIKLRAQ